MIANKIILFISIYFTEKNVLKKISNSDKKTFIMTRLVVK